MLTNVGKSPILSGEENEKRNPRADPHHHQKSTTCQARGVRQLSCLQNDRTNERMTENDHITSALLTEVIIIIIAIIIWYRHSDRVKIDRQDIFN